ncbi:putative trancriptional regulator, ArsR family [Halalkaliarchaeum sp. AArc-CO]|uniref:DUF7344 domain-containing protein n=1 Tax=unclassified Halalkaliarchaeum TaxID=2678344 RepID=UPI00217CEF45|nr:MULTISPECIES: hypothetical protein [unclassified Halalkaliarchaeum]MDR5671988.1 hypothetical protein [Halalkaliarchaeum sp. AArc-GB]UWG51493.1 putative trancriptional regulator, ArsR family [Halalkaliarchaeum sp. AArc-CO]
MNSDAAELSAPSGAENEVGDEAYDLTKDEIFGTLSNARRRYVLSELKRSPDGESTIRDLSSTIAGLENGVAPHEVTYAQRKRVYTSLYQSHVPQLARRGIVDYDARSGTVSLTDVANTFDVYLEVVEEKELTWAEFYVLLSIFSGVLLGAVTLEAVFFASLSGLAAATIIAVAFASASIAQLYQTRKNRL